MLKFLIFFCFCGVSLSNGSLLFSNRRKSIEGFGRNSAPLISPAVQENKFKQKLDHFNKADTRTWKQLYFFKDNHYELGGPVYLWLWDIGEAYEGFLEEEYWHSHAKKNNAFLFLLEHRFQGRSQPFGDTATENLRFLNTSQALADTAAFIMAMNEEYEFPDDTKWIVFGGYYGGSLAAWMRLKYPKLVHGAVASSAPVVAQLDVPEYLNSVGQSLASYKKQCQKDVELANEKIDKLVNSDKGRKELGDIFKLCSPLKNDKLDISYFVSNMADYIAFDIDYDRWGRNAKKICDKMLEKSKEKEPIKRYSNLMKMFLERNGEECLATKFNDYVGLLKRSDLITASETNRVWIYHLCTQFAWFTTSGKKSKTFSKHINLNLFVSTCSKVFKSSFNKKFIEKEVKKTNSLFGGSNIDEPRLLFVQGSADPLRSVGITTKKNKKNVEVITVQGGSQCSELGEVTSRDPYAKKDAQNKIKRIIDSWL